MIVQELRKAADNNKIILDGYYDWSEIKSSTHHTNYHTDTNPNVSKNTIQIQNSNDMKRSIENLL